MSSTFSVINPATEQVVEEVPDMSAEEADEAIESGGGRFPIVVQGRPG